MPPPTHALAVHEAAHAVVAEATGYGVVAAVTIEGEFGFHGRAGHWSVSEDGFPKLTSSDRGRAYLWAAAITTAAGPVAQTEAGVPCAAWNENEEVARDGYGIEGEMTDYGIVSRVAALLGVEIPEVWERTREFVAQPEVWSAITAVADALVGLREQGRPASLDAAAYRALVGDSVAELAFTTINDAMEAARYGY